MHVQLLKINTINKLMIIDYTMIDNSNPYVIIFINLIIFKAKKKVNWNDVAFHLSKKNIDPQHVLDHLRLLQGFI